MNMVGTQDSLVLAANAIKRELEELVRRQRKLESALKPLLSLIEEGHTNGSAPETKQGAENTVALSSNRIARKGTTIVQGAEILLRQAGEPLRTAEIARGLLAAGFRYDKSFATLRGSVMGSIDHRVAKNDTFCKVGPGLYGLIEWGLNDDEPAAGDDPPTTGP